jgi:hypothetical protein
LGTRPGVIFILSIESGLPSWCAVCVDRTPGNGTLGMACIRNKISVLLIAKNGNHKELLLSSIKERIVMCMQDAPDT